MIRDYKYSKLGLAHGITVLCRIGMGCGFRLKTIFFIIQGGMKAVVWADVFQMTIAFMGFIAIIVKGSMDLGGFQTIVNISRQGDRIELWK